MLSMVAQMLNRLMRVGRRGAVAAEFAVVGVAMLMVIILAIEVTYAMVARGTVEAGLERASRIAATGAGGPTMAGRIGKFDSVFSNMLGGMVDYPASITNTFTAYEQIDFVLNPPLGYTPATDLGQTKWYVVYTTVYQHQLLTGGMFCNFFPAVGCDGHLRMDMRVMRQNEPF